MGPRSPDSPVFSANPSLKDMRDMGTEKSEDCSVEGSAGEVLSVSTPISVVTPSSVVIGSPTGLHRNLSDLSGSYVNGSPMPNGGTPSRAGVPRNIFSSLRESPLAMRQPWRQAYMLSSPAPDDDGPAMPVLNYPSLPEDMIMVERNGGVEVVSPEVVELKARLDVSLPARFIGEGNRFPIVIVLMHPGNKTYELLRVWLDTENDTVRAVLHSVRQNIPNSWNQDYDGLVQPRGNRLSQLINCMRIKQFAAVPHEVWVAKPWALAVEHTTRYAENLLDHLKEVGLVHSSTTDSPRLVPQAGEGVLTLSPAAQKRIYAPGGTLTHYHAMHYLSFYPPFDNPSAESTPYRPLENRPAESTPTPETELLSKDNNDTCSHVSMDLYLSDSDPSRVYLSDSVPLRAVPPELWRSKSPTLTLSDSSTQESQDCDDGTVKMTANLRSHRMLPSSQSLESLQKGLRRRRRFRYNGRRAHRHRSFGGFFSGLNCLRRQMDEPEWTVTRRRSSSQDLSLSAYTLALDDNLLTLYEADSEDERSMAEMPLLIPSNRSTSRFLM